MEIVQKLLYSFHDFVLIVIIYKNRDDKLTIMHKRKGDVLIYHAIFA